MADQQPLGSAEDAALWELAQKDEDVAFELALLRPFGQTSPQNVGNRSDSGDWSFTPQRIYVSADFDQSQLKSIAHAGTGEPNSGSEDADSPGDESLWQMFFTNSPAASPREPVVSTASPREPAVSTHDSEEGGSKRIEDGGTISGEGGEVSASRGASVSEAEEKASTAVADDKSAGAAAASADGPSQSEAVAHDVSDQSSSTSPSAYLSNMFSFQEQTPVDGDETKAEDESVYRRISTFFSPLDDVGADRRLVAEEAKRTAAEAKAKKEELFATCAAQRAADPA